MSTDSRGVLASVLVGFGLLVPTVGLAVATQMIPATPDELRVVPVLATGNVSLFEDDGEMEATVYLKAVPSEAVRAPDWSGLVQEIYVGPGKSIRSGEKIARVGGAVVVGYSGPFPLARNLQVGDKGLDVKNLQLFLRERGLLEFEPDGRYGSGTARAVKEWRESVGDIEPAGDFSAGSLLWLPQPVFEIGTSQLLVGGLAPAAGDVVFESAAEFTIDRIVGAGARILEFEQDYTIELAGETIGIVGPSGPSAAQVDQIARVAQSGQPPSSDIENSGELVAPIVLRLNEPVLRTVVAVGAVLQDGERTCVFLVDDDQDLTSVDVQVRGGSLGAVYVDGVDEQSGPVLINPIDYLRDPTCG